MSCLAEADDVRDLNFDAFGLAKLDESDEPVLAKIMRNIEVQRIDEDSSESKISQVQKVEFKKSNTVGDKVLSEKDSGASISEIVARPSGRTNGTELAKLVAMMKGSSKNTRSSQNSLVPPQKSVNKDYDAVLFRTEQKGPKVKRIVEEQSSSASIALTDEESP